MENQKFLRRLLYYDQDEFSRQIADFRRNLKILNQIAEKYEEFFIGKITQERIGQIFEGNFEVLMKDAKAAIAKKSKNELLSQVSVTLFKEKFSDFVESTSHLVSLFKKTAEKQIYATPTPVERYGIDSNGSFFIPDETIEKIRERCTNYISSPEEQEILDLLQKASDAINDVFEKLGPKTKKILLSNFLSRHYNICEFLTEGEEGKTIPDRQINYKYLTQ